MKINLLKNNTFALFKIHKYMNFFQQMKNFAWVQVQFSLPQIYL